VMIEFVKWHNACTLRSAESGEDVYTSGCVNNLWQMLF
jgi:hypothetical protein